MSDPCPPPDAPSAPPRRFWGKHRGTVLDNVDPLGIGRLLIAVPQVPGTAENWAMPCVPYAGPEGVGFFAMPELGANVWVEFEGGDPSFPIWVGCFWGEGEAPEPYSFDPLYKVFKTPGNMLLFNDTPEVGGATLISEPPAVDDIITLKFSSEGILMTAPPGVFNMSIEEGITMEFPACVLSMSEEEFSLVIPASALVLTEEGAALTAPDIEIGAEAAIQMTAGADATIIAPTLTIEVPGIEITGVAEWAGDLNLTGGFEVEGEVNVLGAVTVEGEQNNLGALTVEGDVNVLGAAQVEGALTVLGVITMDGFVVMVIPI